MGKVGPALLAFASVTSIASLAANAARAADAAMPVAAPPQESATASDKSNYWLFNPVPASALRDFNTDRPTKANVPYTVDAGHFQYETDLFNYAVQVTDTTRTHTWLVPNPTVKVGLTNNVDLEVNVAPYVNIRSQNLAAGTTSTFSGIGDLFTRLKINLWGNDGGKTAFALIPFVKVPTAPIGIGNGAVESGIIAPLSISLPNDFTLLFNSEVDLLRNSDDDGRHVNFNNLVNLSRPIVKNVTLYGELWSSVNVDPVRTITQYSFDVALAWTLKPNVQVDIGLNLGLNRDTPAVQFYTGLSQRF